MNELKWNKTFALEQAAGDAELLEELLEIFRQSYASDLDIIKNGINAGNATLVRGAAHSIKGAAASLGITGIKDIAESIEREARGGSLLIAEKQYEVLVSLKEKLDYL
jgi:HPt (histidine-containing phosphotransfer) domain-containing protein